MGTTADKLTYLNETKTAIKEAIIAKGGDIASDTPFREYADKISELPAGVVDKRIFGVSIEDIFGSVSSDGSWTKPNVLIDMDMSGVVVADPNQRFSYFAYNGGGINQVYAPDLIELKSQIGVFACRSAVDKPLKLFFPKLKKVATSVFDNFASLGYVNNVVADFGSLEEIVANNVFASFLNSSSAKCNLWQRAFPKLKKIWGTSVFMGYFAPKTPKQMLPLVEDIYGLGGSSDITSPYSSTFGGQAMVYYLPKCIRVPSYLVNHTKAALHFAIKNRAVIEACNGFANNFGAGSVIFDLVSAITVNDVVYQRSEVDSITDVYEKFYTAWKSDGGDVVYTYDGNYTVEPAVGTDVFSDGGQTVVGTVSAIE